MSSSSARAALVHPLSLAAIALLVINDHVLKHAYRGVLTGKLSDVAGMAFFPLFLWALCSLFSRDVGVRTLLGCVFATGLVFTAMKTVPACTEAYRQGLGGMQWVVRAVLAAVSGHAPPRLRPVMAVTDPSDLLALPALGVALFIGMAAKARRVPDAIRAS